MAQGRRKRARRRKNKSRGIKNGIGEKKKSRDIKKGIGEKTV